MLAGCKIAIVEDDEIMGASLMQRLAIEGAKPIWWKNGDEASAALRKQDRSFDAVVCDIRLPEKDGESIFREVSASAHPPPFLFLTAHGDIDQAVRLLRAGASDYLTKPFEFDVFLERLSAIARSPDDIHATGSLGVSSAMQAIEKTIARVADTDLPVLFRGETGTGKEVAARFLHKCSTLADEPFVPVNCAALPNDLIESEIFGHEKGAFTGAHARHIGAAERAEKGTLFLDEIGDMPVAMQAKLLRLIEDGSFLRVGGEKPVSLSARVISATHHDLASSIKGGAFREDLLYRLNTIDLEIPALRSRPDDTVWLLQNMFAAAISRRPTELKTISALAEECAAEHDWPGNARELRNRVERGVALASGTTLMPGDLFPEIYTLAADDTFKSLSAVREAAEQRQIQRALRETDGRIIEAANLLDISRTTLWEKMQKFGISVNSATEG